MKYLIYTNAERKEEVGYLSSVSSEAALRGEPLAADVAVEGPVLQPLDLALVVAQVLLQVRQLDEGPPALGDVTFVRSLSCNLDSI